MSWALFDSILRDAGFGLRLWRRHKTVTAAAIVSLSLALAASRLTCLLVACALSGLIPALRAIRIDPATALRHQ